MVGTILNCTQQYQHINKTLTRLNWGETERQCFFYPDDFYTIPAGCSSYFVIVPTDKNYNIITDKNFQRLNQRGFQITWDINRFSCPACTATGGRCYYGTYGTSRNTLYGYGIYGTNTNHGYDYETSGFLCIFRHGVYYSNPLKDITL